MVRETEFYLDEDSARVAKLRSAPRHTAGFRPIHTTFKTFGVEIVWSNDPDPPPIPPRSLTQRQLLEEIAAERNVRLT